ncbi:MAG: hypothetical protein ACOY94_18235 [Bacillota bacterium]
MQLMSLSFLPQLLVFLMLLAGIGLAIANWRKHPQVSLLALIGLVLILGSSVFSMVFSLFMLPRLAGGRSMMSLSTLLVILSSLQALATAAGWGCVLAAIFGWRRSA